MIVPINDNSNNGCDRALRITREEEDNEESDINSDCQSVNSEKNEIMTGAANKSRELLDSLNHAFKLYDRQEQKNDLVEAFKRCQLSKRAKECVLITGPSGVGKTVLACSLRSKDETNYFISMKFDQFQPPYSKHFNILSAFEEYVQMVESQGQLVQVRENIEVGFDLTEQKILIDCIPCIARILPGVGNVKSHNVKRQELQRRFLSIFVKLLRVIATPQKPLILFLDDLQWCDAGSLDLIQAVFADKEPILGMFILGACRGSEVDFDSALSHMLRSLEDSHATIITDIRVTNMKKSSINEMLSEVLALPKPLSDPLAGILYHYTDGNIFILVQFLKNLHSQKILYVDPNSRQWMWNEKQIHAFLGGTDIVKLLAFKIQNLRPDVQEILQVAACLGPEIDENLLYCIIEHSDVSDSLMIAIEEDLLTIEEISRKPKFLHDRMQQAAYSLIPSKPEFHKRIGKALHQNLSPSELDSHVFLVVSQLHMAELTSQEERDSLAELCLRAGRKAISTSAFDSAADYFAHGIKQLDSRTCWDQKYQLSLALYNAAAEAEYVLANFPRMDRLIDTVLRESKDFSDELQAHTTRVYALGARNDLRTAIEMGFEVLKKQGITFPKKSRTLNIALSFVHAKAKLSKMTDARILNLSIMTNPNSLAAMRLLTLLGCYTSFVKQEYAPLIAMKQLGMTLKEGLCAMSAVAFAAYGTLIGGAMNKIDEAYQYGELALSIIDKFSAVEWIPRVYYYVFSVIKLYREPIRNSLEPLQFAQMVGFETGDIEVRNGTFCQNC